MSKVTQEQKSKIFWGKLTNLLLDYPFFENNVILKVVFKAICEFQKDKLFEIIEEVIQEYKELDEIDEQLDENERELKNILGEIIKKLNLFLIKIYKDKEGENEKKVKNSFINIFRVTQAYFKN